MEKINLNNMSLLRRKNSTFLRVGFILFFMLFISKNCFAINSDFNKRPIPRFASIKFEEVNVRYGPGKNYPVKYILKRKNLPVKIVKEFEYWYLLKMVDASTAWIHKSQLSGNRFGFIKIGGYSNIYEDRNNEKVIAKVGNGNVVKLDRCLLDSAFCKVSIGKVSGYLKKSDFFGLLEEEEID